MSSSDAIRELDNAFWSGLATRHAHISLGGSLARRYPVDISPIAGLPGNAPANITALEELVAVGDDVATAGPYTPKLPANWKVLYESRLTQMIRAERTPLPEGNAVISVLGTTDVADMLALAKLAKPGPFRQRTIELGTYVGIREGGKLIAMAGERMWVADCREVSAVCTHPDAQGRGHARVLMANVVNRMLRAGQIPYLHVDSNNQRAIDLYLALGFVRRTEYPLLYAKRIG